MDREHFHQIAPPRNRFACAAEFQSGHFDDRAVRHVLARNPFRVIERQRAGRAPESPYACAEFFAPLAKRQPPGESAQPWFARAHSHSKINSSLPAQDPLSKFDAFFPHLFPTGFDETAVVMTQRIGRFVSIHSKI